MGPFSGLWTALKTVPLRRSAKCRRSRDSLKVLRYVPMHVNAYVWT
jgi:hypothetical protein